ncbi:hypothetical protein C0Q70_04072 [Pomacea canaliculata]|uniref:Uncharacterized protein n=1 Tax=Pomacea canaliculata TaxID=400727 RepID=A0A2T7PUI8_POMCA|nr:hypothetical protein C0Q70_04072 [Pomacea canaliculata]
MEDPAPDASRHFSCGSFWWSQQVQACYEHGCLPVYGGWGGGGTRQTEELSWGRAQRCTSVSACKALHPGLFLKDRKLSWADVEASSITAAAQATLVHFVAARRLHGDGRDLGHGSPQSRSLIRSKIVQKEDEDIGCEMV